MARGSASGSSTCARTRRSARPGRSGCCRSRRPNRSSCSTATSSPRRTWAACSTRTSPVATGRPIGTRRYLHTVPFGCVERDGDRVTQLEEKPTLEREVNSGIYALDPSVVARVGPGQRRRHAGSHRRPARRRRARRRVRDRGRMDRCRPARAAGRGARGRHVTLRGTKVLVTGADGFIGSHLTERLVAEGADVRAFCLYNSRGSAGWLDETDAATRAALDIRLGDIRDARFVAAATEGVEIVFHLAALIAIPYSYAAPQSFIDTNVSGTLHALEAARSAGVRRFIQTSTSEVYGTPETLADPRDPPLRRAIAVRGVEGRRRPADAGVRQELRAPRRRAPAVQHLRAAPVGAGGPADDAPPAPRRQDGGPPRTPGPAARHDVRRGHRGRLHPRCHRPRHRGRGHPARHRPERIDRASSSPSPAASSGWTPGPSRTRSACDPMPARSWSSRPIRRVPASGWAGRRGPAWRTGSARPSTGCAPSPRPATRIVSRPDRRIPLSEPSIGGNAAAYLEECLATNFVSSVGPFVERFEASLRRGRRGAPRRRLFERHGGDPPGAACPGRRSGR